MMSFLVWLLWRIFQKGTGRPRAIFFIAAILISAFLFAAGHLPIAVTLAGQTSAPVVAFVLAGNSLFGLVAGFLYWKKGLETAIIAHIFTHVILLTAIKLGA
jgi:membrane protease YdiL (CAAX protease family)